jgi:hypothetical protein
MRVSLRIRVLACVCALAALAAVSPARGEPCPDSVHVPLQYSLIPEVPCDGDSVTLVISACGPCVQIVDVESTPRIVVHARMRSEACIAAVAVCELERRIVPLGRFHAGFYELQVEVRGEIVNPDSTVCTTTQIDRVPFSLGLCAPPDTLPYIDDVVIGQRVVCITEPCPDLACPNDSIPASSSAGSSSFR